MTEEIIIECAFYKDGVCASPINKTCEYCKNIDVSKCYHKQLKRLEQEYKQAHEDFICSDTALRIANTEIGELKQENERLREELNLHLYGTDDKMIHTLYGKPIQYWIEKKEALDGANELIKGYHLRIKKYKSALEEIREKIKSLNKDICNNCGWYNTDNCQPNGYVCHDLIEIKNKINEVLNPS